MNGNKITKKELEEINQIISEARNSISDYCMNICEAKCCKFGKLVLFNKKEIEFICNGKEEEFLKKKILEPSRDGNYTFNHELAGCPHLTKDNKCSNWNHPNRPRICSDFPLFLMQNKYLITADICPAIKKNKFEKYFDKLKKYGIIII